MLAKVLFCVKIIKIIMKDRKGRSFITIIVGIALLVLILRIAIEQMIKLNISQNESNAQSALKLISTALENYAKDNQGVYPTSLLVLSQKNPPYLDKNYLRQSPIKGYNYSCSRLEPTGYSCAAIPVKCNLTGKKIYSITTGGSFLSEECKAKE